MEKEFWLNRWKVGEIGWHQNEVEPALIEAFSKLPRGRVFVPFCGKSLDMVWLLKNGFEVIGAELSPLACESFFSENNLSFMRVRHGDFWVYKGAGIQIYQGDFFALHPEVLEGVSAIYDRAALIALPPEMRIRYSKHLEELLAATSKPLDLFFLQILLEKEPLSPKGPPFSVSRSELEDLYQKSFAVDLLSREKVEEMSSADLQIFEAVYRLRART